MAEKRFVACPKCGTFNEFDKGLWGWGKESCSHCSHKYGYAENECQSVTCKSCRRQVMFTQQHVDVCPYPDCGKPLMGEERLAVGCPKCTAAVYYTRGQNPVVCPNCEHAFDPEHKIATDTSVIGNEAPDILMTGTLTPDQLFWQHPLTKMPLNTRVMGKSGMQTVGMQAQTQVFLVDGPSVLLSETALRNDAAQYDGGSEPMTHVEIYYVRQAINTLIKWGGGIRLTDGYGMVWKCGVTGTISIANIIDPAAFLRTFGFDPAVVLRSKFAMIDPNTPAEFAIKVRDRIRTVLQQAMEIVRDERGYVGAEMMDHQPEVLAEMLRQANAAVAEFGISLTDMNGTFTDNGTEPASLLERRVAGAIKWNVDHPVMVHAHDDMEVFVNMNLRGHFNVAIHNKARLEACLEAREWRNPSKPEECARNDFATYMIERMQGRFMADLQQLINTTQTDIRMLESFSGSLIAKTEALLNAEDGYFGSRGMRVRDFTVLLEIVSKSPAYINREKVAAAADQAQTEVAMDTIETGKTVAMEGNKRTRTTATTDTAVHDVEQRDRVDEAEHIVAKRKAQREADLARMQREFGFEAWEAKQRMLTAQEEADYARAHRARMARQEGELSQAEHEERMFAVAQRIEQSKLTWREKLDAYARLQRGMAFRDQMDEREVTAEADFREERMRRELAAEDVQLITELQREQDARQEEMARNRFAREMEMRRQQMAEEAARLQAQFERERAAAQEEEKRAQASEEIETLRLMLEYLAKTGDQQVTQERLREAREQARADWEREHQAAERQAAEARHERQLASEREMHQRAEEMLLQLAAMQNNGHAGMDPAAMQAIMATLTGLCDAIKSGASQPAQQPASNPMNAWFDTMVSKAGKGGSMPGFGAAPHAAPAPQAPAAPAGGSIVCGGCGKFFDRNAYLCPYCGWQV